VVTYERRVGRLLEIRIVGEHKVESFGRPIALAKELGPDAKVVVIADWRKAELQNREQIDRLITAMRGHAQRVEQGVLLAESGHHAMLAERIKQNALVPIAVVRSIAEALAQLKPVLDAAELTRAKQFLEEKS
jgi:hypothetical protein